MSDGSEMRSFWDEKAAENPLWYVASELDYSSPDVERFWASGEEDVSRILREVGVERGRTAVDIGCGVGRLSRALSTRFDRVLGFDVSPRMAELAARNLSDRDNVTFAAASGTGALDVPDGAADFVLSLQVFQHIPERAATLRYIREAGRVLAPGGLFVFQLRSCRLASPVAGRLERAVRRVVDRIRRARAPGPPQLRSPAWSGSRVGIWEIRRAVADGGMAVRDMRWISTQGASLMVVARKAG